MGRQLFNVIFLTLKLFEDYYSIQEKITLRICQLLTDMIDTF